MKQAKLLAEQNKVVVKTVEPPKEEEKDPLPDFLAEFLKTWDRNPIKQAMDPKMRMDMLMMQHIQGGKLYMPEEIEINEVMKLLPLFRIFENLDQICLFRIAQKATRETIAPGTILSQEGEVGEKTYFIVSGRCHVRMQVEIFKKDLRESSQDPRYESHTVHSQVPHLWEKYRKGGTEYTVGRSVEI